MVGDVLCINLLEVYVQARLPVYSKLSLVNYSSIPATSSANRTLHYGNSFIDEIQIFTDGTFLLYCLNCEMSSCQKHMKFYVVPTVLSFKHTTTVVVVMCASRASFFLFQTMDGLKKNVKENYPFYSLEVTLLSSQLLEVPR